jgi:hypothetical protein
MASRGSDVNPHIRDGNSPLQALIMQALRRYGEFSPGTVDGDTSLMFIEFANMVIDEVRSHPYGGDLDVPYYLALEDARGIPDPVVIAGILYHYSMQQGSEKVQFYMPNYFRTLNQLLWQRLNGNTKIRMRVPDDGTSPRNSTGVRTDPVNGTSGGT